MTGRDAAAPGGLGCHGVTAFPAPLDPPVDRAGGDRALRALTLVVMLCGLAGMARASLLSTSLAVGGGLACAGACAAAWPWASGAGVRAGYRRLLSFGVLFGTLATVVKASGGDLTDLSPTLGATLVGLAVAHALVEDTRRDLVVGVLIGALMLVLAAGVAPGSAIAVPVVAGWLAVLAVLVVAQRSAAADLAHVAAEPAGPRAGASVPWTVLRSVGVVLLVGAFLLLLVPHPGGLSLRSRLARGDLAQSGGPATRPVGSYDGGSMNLLARGGLSDEPVLQVSEASPSLWRGTVLDTYSDNSWSVSSAAWSGDLRVYPRDSTIPPAPLEGPVSPGTPRTDEALPYAGFSGVIVAPGRIVGVRSQSQVVEGPALYFLDPSATDGLAHSMAYAVTSVPIVDVHAVEGASDATIDDTGGVDAVWTSLPPTVPARVLDLGRSLVAPTTDPIEAVTVVEDFVRHRARYTLDSPLPARGEDAVDDFLFNSHLGFCEHFASAEVVLLRAAGVPARVVTGYAAGTDNGDGTRTFHGTDAHAWVEAWIPGRGWVSSDPTAGAALADASGSGLSSITHRISVLMHSAAGRLALAAALAAAVVVGFGLAVLSRRIRRRRGRSEVSDEAAADELDPLPAFHRLETALVSTGAGRAVGESVTELARRLPTDAADADAFRAVDETCYAATPPESGRREAAAGRLDAFTDAWRRRRH